MYLKAYASQSTTFAFNMPDIDAEIPHPQYLDVNFACRLASIAHCTDEHQGTAASDQECTSPRMSVSPPPTVQGSGPSGHAGYCPALSRIKIIMQLAAVLSSRGWANCIESDLTKLEPALLAHESNLTT